MYCTTPRNSATLITSAAPKKISAPRKMLQSMSDAFIDVYARAATLRGSPAPLSSARFVSSKLRFLWAYRPRRPTQAERQFDSVLMGSESAVTLSTAG